MANPACGRDCSFLAALMSGSIPLGDNDMPAEFESGAFSKGEPAWHHLGVVLPDQGLTSEQALRFGGLAGWEIEKLPLFTRRGIREIEVPDNYATVRTFKNGEPDDTVLGVVGDRYRIVSNEDAFAWVDGMLGGDGSFIDTAGSLYGGRKVWLLVDVPFTIHLPDSEYRGQLFVRNSHDGSHSVEASYTTTRVVCANTYAMARSEGKRHGGVIKIRHTASAEQRLAEAQRALGLAQGAAERSEQLAITLLKQKLSEQQVMAVVDAVFTLPDKKPETTGEKRSYTQLSNKRDAVLGIYRNADDQQDIKGTAWGVYSAFTNFVSHLPAEQRNVHKAQVVFENIMTGDTVADQVLELVTAL